ncbi:hypothetical protein TanjilG_08698 [Lupinus angustifolius]|uniref:Longin domain-containing protein n=1 Tax=Lupinus angustifolius TaxID=3871 RepID=A0A4P1QXH0_LUPAN|nr:PREDICTED: phytolongin Phyl2.2 [Lupinus angustifolius]OIV96837.1 hypothetical protein TanjilG_08698 [Lupinus angustifolius]
MISNPELIHYACIAKQTTILAQHNTTNDPKIESLASQCIEQTPPNHSLFSHTHNNRTFTFLIDYPFTFFAIFNNLTLKSETLAFLNAVKTASRTALDRQIQASGDLHPMCFQLQFDSIIKETLNFGSELTGNSSNSIVIDRDCGNPRGKRPSTVPLLGKPLEGLKKKKRVVGSDLEGKDGNLENKVEVSDSEVNVCNRDLKGMVNDHRQKAKHIWKKHVWVVLLLDLFVCAVLFVIWLWVCSGFKCMAY